MRAILNTVIDELNRLKAAGVSSVNVSEESLQALRRAVVRRTKEAPRPAPAAAAPSPRQAAEAGESAKPAPAAAFAPLQEAPAAKPAVKRQSTPELPPPPEILVPEAGTKAEKMDWLKARLHADATCLAQLRPEKQLVLGAGSLDAKIVFIGEAPGAEEETQGLPFVGPAGQLLTKMIAAMGLSRDEIYIGNILKWRPRIPGSPDDVQYGNREPNEEEMRYCLPYLSAQLAIIQPDILVGLGATAAKGMLGASKVRTLSAVRGRWHEYLGRPLLITYHPSYLLRKESEGREAARKAKRLAWEDLLLVMEKAGLPISEKQQGYFRATP